MNRAIPLSIMVVTIATIALSLAALSQAQEGVSIEVSPTIITPTVSVGDSTAETITVTNSSALPVLVRSENQEAPDDDSGIHLGVLPDELAIEPGASGEFQVGIDVDAEATEGLYESTILFIVSPADEHDVSITGQVAAMLQLEVIRPVSDVRLTYPRFLAANQSAPFTMEGTNTGRFTTTLAGRVEISGFLVADELLIVESDPLEQGESADLQVDWQDAPAVGLVRAKVSLGSSVGAPVTEEVWILVFPWRLGLTVLMVIIVAAAAALVYRRRR